MKRRSAIKTISLGAGYTMTGAGFMAFLSGCKSDGSMAKVASEWAPSFLSSSEAKLVDGILEELLPKTEKTPGARELNLVQVVDNVVNKLFKQPDQEDYKEGLSALAARFKNEQNIELDNIEKKHISVFMEKYFGTSNSQEQQKFNELRWKDKSEISADELEDFHFANVLHTLREQGIETYFSHEKIATEYLSYDPVPGVFNGCIPVSEVGSVWSL